MRAALLRWQSVSLPPSQLGWEPEQLSRLADRISRAAHRYCIDLADLDAASDKAKGAEDGR